MNDELHCAVCYRRVVVLPDGTVLHRLPTPEALPVGEVGRRWGMEIGLFTLATSTHEARVAA